MIKLLLTSFLFLVGINAQAYQVKFVNKTDAPLMVSFEVRNDRGMLDLGLGSNNLGVGAVISEEGVSVNPEGLDYRFSVVSRTNPQTPFCYGYGKLRKIDSFEVVVNGYQDSGMVNCDLNIK